MVHLSERQHVRRKGHRADACSCNLVFRMSWTSAGNYASLSAKWQTVRCMLLQLRRGHVRCKAARHNLAGSQACRSCVCGLAWFSGCPLCGELCVPPQNRFAGVSWCTSPNATCSSQRSSRRCMLLQLRRGHVRCKAATHNLCRKSSVSVLRMWTCVVFRMSSLQGIMRPSSKPVCRCLHGAPLRTPTCSSQRSSRRCMLLQLRRGHVRCKAARYNLCRKSSVSVLRMWTCVVPSADASSLQRNYACSSSKPVCSVSAWCGPLRPVCTWAPLRKHVRRKGHRGEVMSGARRRCMLLRMSSLQLRRGHVDGATSEGGKI